MLLLASDTGPKVAVLMKELRRHLNELLKAKVRSDMSIRDRRGVRGVSEHLCVFGCQVEDPTLMIEKHELLETMVRPL